MMLERYYRISKNGEKKSMTRHHRKRAKKIMIVNPPKQNYRMIKSGKKTNEKNIKKQSTGKNK